jgi:hypothetical protein
MGKKRKHQVVMSKRERIQIALWMIAEWSTEEDRPFAWLKATAAKFDSFFGSENHTNVRQKIRNIWKNRIKYVADETGMYVTTTNTEIGIGKRSVFRKALSGRGMKRTPCTVWIHHELDDEMRRLELLGCETSYMLIANIAKRILVESTHPIFNSDFVEKRKKHEKEAEMEDENERENEEENEEIEEKEEKEDEEKAKEVKEKKYINKINYKWARRYCISSNLVLRTKTGKPKVSEEKEAQIDREVAYHLGVLKRSHDNGQWKGENMVNMDETHFIFAMEKQKTLAVRGMKKNSVQLQTKPTVAKSVRLC